MTKKPLRIACIILRDPSISIIALASELGMATSGVGKHLKAMREAGALRRIGPAKGRRWEVVL